jgi:hypothetical protein
MFFTHLEIMQKSYVLKIFLFFILGILYSFSQNIKPYDLEMQAKHAEIKGYDPSFRVNYFENIIIKTEITSNVANLHFESKANGLNFDIIPIAEYQISSSFDYKFMALGFSFSPKFLMNPDRGKNEDSQSFGLRLNFFFSDRLRQELNYQYYKGFYSKNASDETNIFLANTTLGIFEGSTYFIANKNYSFRAHYAQTERQLKSAGSFIPKLNYSISRANSNLTSTTTSAQLDFIDSIDLIGQVGYLYTYVLNKKWFATGGLHPGFGYNFTKYAYQNNEANDEIFHTISFAMNSDISIGYNSYRVFYGASYNRRFYNYTNNKDDLFNRNSEFFNLYFGYRFNDNKPMRKFFGWFEDTFGF